MKSIISREDNVIFETPTRYVYKVSSGRYQVREYSKSFTHSTVIFDLENKDEDEDTKQRAIEFCGENLQ
jgi:hypothetical protein